MRIQTLSLLSPVDSILVVSVDALEARLIVHCEGLQLYLGQLLWPAGGHGGTHAVHGGQVLEFNLDIMVNGLWLIGLTCLKNLSTLKTL